MRILITGIFGFIGSHLAKRLCERGHDIVGVASHEDAMSPQSLMRLAKFPKFPNFDWIDPTGDIGIYAPFDACVHLAGRSSVRESLIDPLGYEAANCFISTWILDWMQHMRARRVIHASSVMIYGKDAPLPYTEDKIGSAPASFYGASKLAAEVLMNTWRVLHGMETINLRFFSVYGPDLRPDCVPHLIASAIQNGTEFTLFGDGSSVRDYVEIEDVLDAIEAALHVPWTQDFPTSINIGSGVGTRLIDLLSKIEQGLEKKARIVHNPAQAGEQQAIVADVRLAKRVLNWSPRVGLDDGIRRFAEWFKQSRRL
ncbi:MAG TPA: NAD-dependent epimerase/dehydratase family protein [Planctomycetota bacterium]|nr:NAD-dependent epimerase/dehydratase family protein [Planctomycetota bacterium]